MKYMLLRTRLILSFCGIALMSAFAIELSSSIQLHHYFTTNTYAYHASTLQQFCKSTENELNSAHEMLNYLSFNYDIRSFFTDDAQLPPRQMLDTIYELQAMLSTMLSYSSNVSAVNLYPIGWERRVYADKSAYFSIPESPYQQPWFLEFAASSSVRTAYLSQNRHTTRYNLVRKVMDPISSQWVGIVIVSYELKHLDDFAETLGLNAQSTALVYDDAGNLIYCTDRPDPSGYEKAVLEYRPARTGCFTEKINGQNTLVAALHSEATGWTFFSATPTLYVNAPLYRITAVNVGIAVLTLTMIVLVSLRLSRNISRPVADLEMHMRQVIAGDFKAHMNTDRTDEIGSIIHTFNSMTEKVDMLISTVYETRLRQKESENRALQAQINPHFMYNTLESIRMLAVLNDDDDSAEAIKHLGKYLRYAADWRNRFVDLGEELLHLQDYLAIYSLKNDDIACEYQVPRQLHTYRVVKMTIQPLVENSLLHGLKKRAGGILRIKAEIRNDQLLIIVSDNGVGMTQAEINQLQAALESDEPDQGIGIGLRNIHHRIRLYCGDLYGLMLRTGVLGGLDVILKMPLVPRDEEETHDVQNHHC